VVVSQGRVANRDPGALIEPTLRALAGMDALVVAVTGREVALRDVPANARVAEFISFEQLLPHTDVLVSNGGLGGVQQALRFGVPLVLAGDTEDKIEVTAHAAWTGAAINLATGRPTESAIGRAVLTALTDPRYRDRAGKMAEEYATYDVFAEIESVIDEFTGVPALG
jgi:UDP:flavonoid glycosyltransferase YjiC (YdhE family)